ncbi:3-carboxy-cis,cis-muconate cycloisomerase [Actinomadura craniellae]|uniref:3-carboxy-cis,cis-muconate cycloisomerase n=1 Tax=Actinomadura craniellae TaxID=2231787 RepID=A0A365HC81_9ACTN|nr:3-carboxy-cis,cis-muconate cycloisomerase [Actinomadura craniellae]
MGLLAPARAGASASTGDAAWVRALLDAEAALARAQARAGTVPAAAAAEITRVAAGLRPDPGALALRALETGNPVVPLLAELRAALDPAVAGHVHRGATSQDIVDTATMLVAHRALEPVLAALDRTLAALAGLAGRYRDTPMPARTLGQRAVPTTFGLKAAGWLLGCLDAREELDRARRALPVQLGGAAGTLAAPAGPELLPLYAAELGLAEPILPWHTRRAPVLRLGAALAETSGALGKLATDVIWLAQTEVGEVAEPAAPGRGGSSIMAHKRNPVLSVRVRSAALQVPAYVSVLAASAVGEHERPVGAWHAEWQPLRETLRLVAGAADAAAELTGGMVVHPDRMLAGLAGLDGTTGAAAELTDRALAHYQAHYHRRKP